MICLKSKQKHFRVNKYLLFSTGQWIMTNLIDYPMKFEIYTCT